MQEICCLNSVDSSKSDKPKNILAIYELIILSTNFRYEFNTYNLSNYRMSLSFISLVFSLRHITIWTDLFWERGVPVLVAVLLQLCPDLHRVVGVGLGQALGGVQPQVDVTGLQSEMSVCGWSENRGRDWILRRMEWLRTNSWRIWEMSHFFSFFLP